MRALILILIAATVAAHDDWDTFSNPNWWHTLSRWHPTINTDCLLYQGRRDPNRFAVRESRIVSGIPLSRHHIIPGTTLIGFYNTALTYSHQNNRHLLGLLNIIGNLANTFMEYYEDISFTDENIRNQLSQIRLIQLNYLTGDAVSLTGLFDATDLARTLFYWMPLNIFMGPERRSDDPGNSFETNANFIMEDAETYEQLSRINDLMAAYVLTRDPRMFNVVVILLERLISGGRANPYPFRRYQWRATYRNRNGLQFYEIITDGGPTTTTQQPRRYFMKRQAQTMDSGNNDPLCLRPITEYGLQLRSNNLLIAAHALGRVDTKSGLHERSSYNSWRDWFEIFDWKHRAKKYEIASFGKTMAIANYGGIFKDKSFVVGVVGSDLRFGNDSWTNNSWDVNTLGGQMFFDKDSRPVALAVSDDANSEVNKGWLFVYFNCGWKPLPRNKAKNVAIADEFPRGKTDSLDSTGLQFVPTNIVSTIGSKAGELK